MTKDNGAPPPAADNAKQSRPKSQRDLKQQIAHWSYRILRWGRDRVPPVIRSIVGVLLMIGGVFGFLPVLGFWMFPLGLAFIAMDLPFTRARIDVWAESLRQRADAGIDSERNPDN
ncbi:MAG: hypothetical protein AAF515_22070 [Pseudomonadota bacterium]